VAWGLSLAPSFFLSDGLNTTAGWWTLVVETEVKQSTHTVAVSPFIEVIFPLAFPSGAANWISPLP